MKIHKSERGATFVEMAFVSGLFFAVIFAGFEVGRYQWSKSVLESAVHKGLHYLTQSPYTSLDPTSEQAEEIREQVIEHVLAYANRTSSWAGGAIRAEDINFEFPKELVVDGEGRSHISSSEYISLSDISVRNLLQSKPVGIAVEVDYLPIVSAVFAREGSGLKVRSSARGYVEVPVDPSAPKIVDCNGNAFNSPEYGSSPCPCIINTPGGEVQVDQSGNFNSNLACQCPDAFTPSGSNCLCDNLRSAAEAESGVICCDGRISFLDQYGLDSCSQVGLVVGSEGGLCSCVCPNGGVRECITSTSGDLICSCPCPPGGQEEIDGLCQCPAIDCNNPLTEVPGDGDTNCACRCVANSEIQEDACVCAGETVANEDHTECICEIGGDVRIEVREGEPVCVCTAPNHVPVENDRGGRECGCLPCDGEYERGDYYDESTCSCRCISGARGDGDGRCTRCKDGFRETEDSNVPGQIACVCNPDCGFDADVDAGSPWCRCNCPAASLLKNYFEDGWPHCGCVGGAVEVPGANSCRCLQAGEPGAIDCEGGEIGPGSGNSLGRCVCQCVEGSCANVADDAEPDPDDSCRCKCPNENHQPTDGTCQCPAREACDNGFEWDEESCSCLCDDGNGYIHDDGFCYGEDCDGRDCLYDSVNFECECGDEN